MTAQSDNAALPLESIADTKTQLRKNYLRIRDNIPEAKRAHRSAAACDAFIDQPRFKDANVVFAYHPLGSEADTRPLINAALQLGKTVALPVCLPKTKSLAWHHINHLEELRSGYAGICEPPRDPNTLIEPALLHDKRSLAIVPGVIFDHAGYRIGYGGGFYDRFLASFQGTSVGYAFSEQIVHSIRALEALEAHDRAVDAVIEI